MDVALIVFILAAAFKVLLFPAYKSTDFEVHRNWLAITHSLPVAQWYYEATSEWTLDYPPFFAWFEAILSQFAGLIDPAIVSINNLYYNNFTVVWFQRSTVIVTELVLCYAIMEYCRVREGFTRGQTQVMKFVLSCQLLANFGLVIIDLDDQIFSSQRRFLSRLLCQNGSLLVVAVYPTQMSIDIHFQYNGFLFGVLLLSIARIIEGRHLEGAIWFSILLNLKHIFLYISPAYFIYLLKHYCFTKSDDQHKKVESPLLRQFRVDRFLLLGTLVLTVFILSFGPFVTMGQLGQVLSRLFPFKRGLCHAYWAPNFWALYNVIDKTLAIIATRLGYTVSIIGSMTSGLVGEMSHQVLPSVPPIVTLILTLLTMIPPLLKLWFSKSSSQDFIKVIVLCAYSSFLFGWHVHEKAVLLITIPMSLLALEDKKFTRIYLLLSAIGHISLFPLLYTAAETLIKVCLYALFTISSFFTLPLLTLDNAKEDKKKTSKPNPTHHWLLSFPALTTTDSLLLSIVLLFQIFCLCGSFVKFPFLPLLITSVTCSVGIHWTWILTLYAYLFN